MDFSGIVPALPSLWEGMLMTLKLMVLGVLGGVALGTVLALMRLSHSKLLSNIAGFYVNYFRSIPLLLVITWFYFAVPFILPQAFRKMTPLLLQQSIILFQDTSLVYTVGLMDFLNSARSRGDIIGQANEFLIFAGLVYFVVSFTASFAVKRLQKRLTV